MIKIIKPLILNILFIMLLCCSTNINAKSKSNYIKLNARSGLINVSITKCESQETIKCKAASSWRWGAENKCPTSHICAMEVQINNNPVFIPLSAFADLGNPRSINIKDYTEKRFAIVITGGDAATSYTARLEFLNQLLHERIVQHGEFPNDAWEKTKYKFNY